MRTVTPWAVILVLVCCQPTFGGEPITKTGDALVLPAKQLVMANSSLVRDAASPGGQAVQSKGKHGYFVHTTTFVPAGRYRITARVQIATRTVAQHVGRLVVNTQHLNQVDDVTVPFGTEHFKSAKTYKDFSIDIVRPPSKEGRFRLVVGVMHENAKIPVRVAFVKIEALSLPPTLVHKVWPEKLLCRTNADQPITVSLSNTTAQPQPGLKLKLDLIHGLGHVYPAGAKSVTLGPYETTEVVFPWKTGEREYGYEARATLLDRQGKPVSQLSEYFAVSRSHFKLRINGSPRRGHSYLDKQSTVRGAMELRLTYGNYVEVYGWPPSAFAELYPRHRFWTSGQVCAWRYDRDVMKAWIDEMHRLGMWVTSYNISIYNGWPGMEFMRKHPEWCSYDKLGRPTGGVNTAYWRTQAMAYGDDKAPKALPFPGEHPNVGSVWPMDDELMKHAANEIILIHKKLGFDGVRWDGHPIVYVLKGKGGIIGTGFGKMIWNHAGKPIVDLLPDGDLDRQSLHNIRIIKGAVQKAAPEFEWGYNAGYDFTAEEQPRTWKEVATNAGIWVEGGFRSGDEARANPSNTWAKYIDKLYLSSQFVIRSGGYPIHGALDANSSVVRRFMNGIFLAQGSHVCWNGVPWTEYLDHSRFATRYCQYLFDPRIHPWWGYPDIHVTGWVQWEDRNAKKIPPMATEAKITSSRPLFFPEKMLFHRDVSKTEKDTILHLFNHPRKPYVDYTEIDAPPVQKNIEVSLKVPKGMKPKAAWCLSPDAQPMHQKLAIRAADKGWVTVTVPQLIAWNLVVLAWEKE